MRLIRRYRLLGLIAAAGLMFLLFQLFAMKMLGHRNTELINLRKEVLRDMEIHKTDVTTVVLSIPLGVAETDAKYYKPDASGNFVCVGKKQKIPFIYVNDDYCDCNNGSDEPGTAACSQGRFYCTYQIPDIAAQYIVSSRVNDGICDCCDGSDEWNSNLLPDDVVIKDPSLHIHVSHAPCKNTCENVIEIKKEEIILNKMGLRLKQQMYLDAAKDIPNKEQFGPDGAFYRLSEMCFSSQFGKYEYTICPFKSITQQYFPQSMIVLGRTPIWISQKPGAYQLEMVDGDSQKCPDYQKRKSLIVFSCGVQDQVKQIVENEKCSYVIKFNTPAAC